MTLVAVRVLFLTVDTGCIKTAAVVHGAWKRVRDKYDFIISFVDTGDNNVIMIRGPDGHTIKDPTPYFMNGELSIMWRHAKDIADAVSNGGCVLVLCKGGKNRSPFLAGMANAILKRDYRLTTTEPPPSPHDERLARMLENIDLLEKCVQVDKDLNVHEILHDAKTIQSGYTVSHTEDGDWNPHALFFDTDWKSMTPHAFEDWVSKLVAARLQIKSYAVGRSQKRTRPSS